MCLAIPGRLLERWIGPGEIAVGRVAFGSVRREVCLAYTPEAEPGQYLIVHVGFAIQILDEAAANASLKLWAQMDTDEGGEDR
jgi:hydrogenase expression/formation protein HypC